MPNSDYPRLCGGTFFVLILQALKQRIKAREHYNGERDGLSDPEVLTGLIKVINPDYQEPREGLNKGKTNDYKSCKTSDGTYLPFGDTPEIRAFNLRVLNNYHEAVKPMADFIEDFIDTGIAIRKHETLVKALIDLILKDESILDNDEFCIGENGEKTKKAALGDLKEVCLPSFLLGIWHFVVVKRQDNAVGKTTYDKWCPSRGGAKRNYSANMGQDLLQDLKVKIYLPEAESQMDDTFDSRIEDAEPVDETESQQEAPSVSQQMVNNNPTFFNFNISGNNNNVFAHVDKLVLNQGEMKDE